MALIRPFDPGRDLESVLALANADRISGQPLVTPAALAEARSGRSPIDQNWWDDLVDISVDVAVSADGEVEGVVSWASRPRDDAGILLWLHARETRQIIDSLVASTLDRLHGRSHYQAFEFATALGRGLEALPVRHRHQTHLALIDHDFSGTAYWRYLSCSIADRPPAPHLDSSLDMRLARTEGAIGQQMTLTCGDEPVAEVEFDDASDGVAQLLWIAVDAGHRGRGIGRAALEQSLDIMRRAGARQVILYVDDDDPADRDRRPALALYRSVGFTEVDQLFSYARGVAPSVAPTPSG
ncbi:MAG TPA: GNAT family N-acetyltransferase [Propionibacteriaceae bacterium]|nr:GNAT family N-acetyltransferase [Propionibacteriaceae bacterium]